LQRKVRLVTLRQMTEINGSARVRFGAYEVDLHTHELWKHGIRVKLVGQPFEILAVLIARPGQLVTREELRAELWPGDTFVDFNHGLNAAVNKLRDALCDSAEDPKYIETLPRRGYRFIAAVEKATVERVPTEKAPQPETEPKPAVLVEQISEPPAQTQLVPSVPPPDLDQHVPQPKRWWPYLMSAVVVVLAVWLIWDPLRSNPERDEELASEKAKVRPPVLLTSLSDATSDPAFSPDGNWVAFRRTGFVPGVSGIWVKQVGGDELTQITSNVNDCCPVWSRDGRSVAFSRFAGAVRIIYAVPANGGELRKLYSTRVGPKHGELDWSPDGTTIAFVAEASHATSAIFLLSVEDGKVLQLSTPTELESDWGPSFSPDGTQIAFIRTTNGKFPSSIMLTSAAGGEARRLATDPQQVDGAPAWTADGSSIIFAARDSDIDKLWRISVARGIPTQVVDAGSPAWSPAISKRGFRLAYLRMSSARSIEQIDLAPSAHNARGLVTSVGGQNAGPQVSPDGKRLVFMSDRAGGMDIWVSERDGTNPIQLTAVGTAGSPRWSPDGKTIAFDVGLGLDWQLPRAIFVVNADGGTPRPLVQDRFNNVAPSWSRDSALIYFASDRSGSLQVWKVPSAGGAPVQVTTQGGFAVWEASDHYIYYAKHRYPGPELWRIPAAGGAEAPVFPGVQPVDWAAWTVVEKGIFFVANGAQGAPTLCFFDLSSLTIKPLTVLAAPPFWLGAQPDGSSVVFDVPGSEASHIMLLENFR
jgi:Tol biopolymer transport system component/DNA-binding winged helix-turn-helix (wHTH) protein